ncbi:fatty acid desaturase [Puniceibacterium sediminis]|uniref:Fatty acid desaturase n=1 Tax=Puniceibacterium sediminis TaxID=1608407 RepID=A0A238Y1C2_9RHOB|nr:fatty acid desaturase [Puniceibacterium sediminis]SNR64772.1 Fatty acid desaturase [Puniceibacterium sediminis]
MSSAALRRAIRRVRTIEWPTLGLLAACYGGWALGTTWAAALWLPLGMALTLVTTAMHSSLSHEALHGHPVRNPWIDSALVFPPLSVLIPYLRFRDTHLAHHNDAILTDPYDDPESNYLAPAVWVHLPTWLRWLLQINNRLAGRLLIGPALGTVTFWASDAALLRAGDRRVGLAWGLHLAGLVPVVWWMVRVADMPLWAWALSVYGAHGVLKIRTFLEHQAHDRARGRTVIIEDRGPLALIFLNNNLHVVHHMHASVPWYRLPALYFGNRERYLKRNEGYRYASYAEVFRRYFWKAKDPVPHPLWPRP